MEDYFQGESEDLSYSDLDTFPEFLLERKQALKGLQLDHNEISVLPRCISAFTELVKLDISNNNMSYLSSEIVRLKHLRTLNARNNNFTNDALPKDFGTMESLQVLNLSGNQLKDFPPQCTEMMDLRALYLGGNSISEITSDIKHLSRLEILYLGGNQLQEIPFEVGFLSELVSLVLCDNKLQSLPSSLIYLRRLESLSLHNNQLSTLPPDIIKLNLVELSLRNNPLVVRFVQDMTYEPPSLLELAGRVVKVKKLKYSPKDLPRNLVEYLNMAQQCVNPKCKGVYFTSVVEHVKFVDFCGKYRLPLLEYLCSPRCTSSPSFVFSSSSESDSDEEMPVVSKMRKVLLG